MEDGTLFCVIKMHQGHKLSELEEVLQKCTDELSAFWDPGRANEFYSMQEHSRELWDLFCIPVSMLPP